VRYFGSVSDARKLVLRTLDTKISQQEGPGALQAITLADKLAANIIGNPSDPRFQKIRANNPSISRKLLHSPGGTELLLAMGFRTMVADFEEYWVVEATPVELRILSEAREVMAHYSGLIEARLQQAQRLRKDKLDGLDEARKQTLAEIEADKADRKDKDRMRRQSGS
jgi:hypothetical protein